jgi:hypothetical protein
MVRSPSSLVTVKPSGAVVVVVVVAAAVVSEEAADPVVEVSAVPSAGGSHE